MLLYFSFSTILQCWIVFFLIYLKNREKSVLVSGFYYFISTQRAPYFAFTYRFQKSLNPRQSCHDVLGYEVLANPLPSIRYTAAQHF